MTAISQPPRSPSVTTGANPGLGSRILRSRWSYLYLAPFVVGTVLFVVWPIVASIYYTVYRWDGIGEPTNMVGLDNFRAIIDDPIFWDSVGHSVQYTVVLVPVQLVLALVLALVLNDKRLRFTTFYRSVYFLPTIISPAILGVVLQLLITNSGQDLRDAFGLKGSLLTDPSTAMWTIIAIGIWSTLGYNLVYFLAGLQAIPDELYEAARIDGANAWHLFRHVTIPGLRGVGLVVLFIAIIGSLQVFDLVQVLTGGGPYFATSVVNTYIYQKAFGSGAAGGQPVAPDVGMASAAALFYGMLLLALTALQAAFLARYRKKTRRLAG
ncbi:carbohydrate ABC transporter permease [Streptomyces aculeolatus]